MCKDTKGVCKMLVQFYGQHFEMNHGLEKLRNTNINMKKI